MYGPPNSDAWKKIKFPLYYNSEVAKTEVTAEPKKRIHRRGYFHTQLQILPVSLDAFKCPESQGFSSSKQEGVQSFEVTLAQVGQSSGIMDSGKWEPLGGRNDETGSQCVWTELALNCRNVEFQSKIPWQMPFSCISAKAACKNSIYKHLEVQGIHKVSRRHLDVINGQQSQRHGTTSYGPPPLPCVESAVCRGLQGEEGFNTPANILKDFPKRILLS